jgi:hypothetical protein
MTVESTLEADHFHLGDIGSELLVERHPLWSADAGMSPRRIGSFAAWIRRFGVSPSQ